MTKKLQSLASALLIVCAIAFTSCGGDEDDVVLVDVANLTGSTWTFEAVEDAADANSSVGLGFLAPLTLTFANDDSVTGTIVGEGGVPETFEGTWDFTNDVLTFEDEESPLAFDVRELTSARMVLHFEGSTVNPFDGSEYDLDGSLVYTR